MSHRITKAVYDYSRQKGSPLAVLLALAEWADDTGVAYPSVGSIATKARVSEATVHSALRRLIAVGEVVVTPNAGRHGTNLYRILAAGGHQLSLLEGGAGLEGGPDPAPVSLAAPEPSFPRTSKPERGTDGLGAESAPPPKAAPPGAGRTIPDRAERLWVDLRRAAKLERRFCDRSALSTLRERVVLAVRDGATWPDVEAALKAKAAGDKASPWYVDEWIRTAHDERVDREHRFDAEHSRRRRDRDHDDRVEAQWVELEAKHPGMKRSEIIQLETRRRAG